MANNAARFTKRYTDAEKQAILRSVIVERQSVVQTVRKAAAGELGVPAFDLNKTYAYEIVKREREAYEAQNTDALATGIDEAISRLAAKTLRMARTLERMAEPNPDEVRRTVQALKTARAALREPNAPKNDAPTLVQTNATQAPNVIETLLRNAPRNVAPKPESGARGPVRSPAR